MRPKRSILIVDDDPDLRGALAEQLELHEDFAALQAESASEGVKLARERQIDLIILDVDLPDMDGREACRLLRASGVRTPIVMLTAAAGDSDAILGLDSGANDYVTKPFKFSVLLARIRAHLRSHEQSEDALFRIGPYEFRPATKLLLDEQGRRVRLTEKETSILKYLYRAGDKPVQRDELLREVWGYNANVSTHTLETHIYRLRQKIEIDPQHAKLLLTDLGGYRLQT
jgi:DNA-binding response OmpR family regulator